jgi:hypothetical protein
MKVPLERFDDKESVAGRVGQAEEGSVKLWL